MQRHQKCVGFFSLFSRNKLRNLHLPGNGKQLPEKSLSLFFNSVDNNWTLPGGAVALAFRCYARRRRMKSPPRRLHFVGSEMHKQPCTLHSAHVRETWYFAVNDVKTFKHTNLTKCQLKEASRFIAQDAIPLSESGGKK